MLSSLRADQLITDTVGDGKQFGLDTRSIEIGWETDRMHSAQDRLAGPANRGLLTRDVEDQPFVFTIKTEVLKPLEAELRDHVVLSFPAARAQRMVLNWGWPRAHRRLQAPRANGQGPARLGRRARHRCGGPRSVADRPAGESASRSSRPIRFVQYDGEIQPYTGLYRPRLTVEVMLSSAEPTRVRQIGDPTGDGHVFAAEGTSGSGPVFLLPAGAWDALIQSGERFNPLPANVFAPVH